MGKITLEEYAKIKAMSEGKDGVSGVDSTTSQPTRVADSKRKKVLIALIAGLSAAVVVLSMIVLVFIIILVSTVKKKNTNQNPTTIQAETETSVYSGATDSQSSEVLSHPIEDKTDLIANADIYMEQKNYEEAIKIYKDAMQSELEEDEQQKVAVSLALSLALQAQKDIEEGKFDSATSYLDEAELLISENDLSHFQNNKETVNSTIESCKEKLKIEQGKVLSDYGNTITIYVWNDEWKNYVVNYLPGYKETGQNTGSFDGKTVKWIINPSDNGYYQNELDSALSGNEDVDIFLVEADYAQKYSAPGIAKSMGELGIGEEELDSQYLYTQQVVSSDGNIYGSSWQACCSGMIYNRKIAREVLGTDDPNMVQEQVWDWDRWFDVAKKMKKAGYKMTPCAETTYRVYADNMYDSWVDNRGRINIDANILNWINVSKMMVDKGMTGTYGLWETDEPFHKNTAFCVFGPEWYYDYCMQLGSGYSIADYGGWGLCAGPVASYWGGSWVMVADKSDNAKSAATILRTMTMDEAVLKNIMKHYGNIEPVNNRDIMKECALSTSSEYMNSVLGGQNPIGVLGDVAERVDCSKITIYDSVCNEQLQFAMQDYFKGKISYEKAENIFYENVEEIYPELSR